MSENTPDPAGSSTSPSSDANEAATAPQDPADPAVQEETPKKRSWKIPALIAAGVVVVAAAGTGIAVAVMQPTQIERAYEACQGLKPLDGFLGAEDGEESDLETTKELFGPMLSGVLTVEDDGTTLIIQTKSQDDDPLGVGSLAMNCVFEELPVPTYAQTNITSVTGSSGRLTESWDGYEATFSYHPDNGANVVIVKR